MCYFDADLTHRAARTALDRQTLIELLQQCGHQRILFELYGRAPSRSSRSRVLLPG